MAPAEMMMGRVSGSYLDRRRSSQRDSVRVCSETELSLCTSVSTVVVVVRSDSSMGPLIAVLGLLQIWIGLRL